MYHWHIGVLTPSIEESMKYIRAVPGVDESKWLFGEADFSSDVTAAGTSGKLKSAVGFIGGVVYELLEPQDDVSFQAVELRKKGPGIHHTAYVCDGDDELEKTVEAYIAGGAKRVWDVQHGPEHAIYLESGDGSMIIEFINCCPFMPEK